MGNIPTNKETFKRNFQIIIFQNQFSNGKYLDHANEQGNSETWDQPKGVTWEKRTHGM